MTDSAELPPGTVVDRYVVEALLGRGGQARVYRVRHRQLDSLHALKLLHASSPGVLERLMLEGRSQASLRHPNIVAVTDVVESDGRPGLVMELIEGPTLAEAIRAEALGIDVVDHLARGVLCAVEEAHDRGILHRDLKPGNVLLEVRGDRVTPKVSDFGLAKALGGEDIDSATRTGVAMGTPAYMAPEQIHDAKSVDGRADVFSLGVLLYELITGVRPFRGSNSLEIFNAVVAGRYIPVEELIPGVPRRMTDAIEQALVVDRAVRVPSVAELRTLWVGEEVSRDPEVSWVSWATLGPVGEVATLPSEGPRDGLKPVPSDPPVAPVQRTPPQASTTRPAPPSSGGALLPRLGALVAGGLLGLPLTLGVLAVLFGDVVSPVRDGGYFMYVLTALSALAVGVVCERSVAAMRRPMGWLSWVLAPFAVVLAGAVGTAFGIVMAKAALATDVPLRVAAKMAPAGASVAHLTELSGIVLGVTTALLSCVGMVVACRRSGFAGAPGAPGWVALGLALVGGLVLWASHPFLVGRSDLGAPAPFLVFVALLVGSGCVVWLRGTDDSGLLARTRLLVSLTGVGAVALAARAVDIQAMMHLNRAIAEAPSGLARVAAAEDFWAAASQLTWLPVAAWTGLALVVTGVAWAGMSRPRVAGWRLACSGLLAALVVGAEVRADRSIADMVDVVVPGAMADGVYWALGCSVVEQGGDLVVDEALDGSGLRVGDRIVVVGGRAFDDSRSLLEAVVACRCGQTAPCLLDGECLGPGVPLSATILRSTDDGPPSSHEVQVVARMVDGPPL